ncbi:S8 family serine peptidase [Streptacidiphilus cavernicola]|uniref:S8 family serine peptidase n=1 Tax=Streptacidiphilus cavernicola TaxID=3342716 RepID=A0ABV6VSN0_9ACTN
MTRDAQWPLQAYKMSTDVWPHSEGKGVVVAVIDSGVRATHVDLTGQVLPGTDLVNGGNGQTDYADDGHGTGVASLIAGHGHGSGDASGVMGIAPESKILPVGIDPGKGDTLTVIAKAIHYAVDHGAKVINMSFGSPTGDSAVVEEAVAYAEAHDVVLVAASGNDARAVDNYPASFPGVISVGGVDQNGKLWNGETTSSHLTVVAPAFNIVRDGGSSDTKMYQSKGTSFAAAYVSAFAALIRSAYPKLTQGQVVNFIIKGADHSPVGSAAHNSTWGYGLARPNFTLWASMAKNPGPAAGPLPQATLASAATPAPGTGSSSSHPATGVASGGGKSGSSSGLVLAVVGVLVLLVVIVVIVLIARRKKQTPGGPGGPGSGGTPGYGPQTPPPYQQQPQQPQAPQYRPPSSPQPSQQPPYYQPQQPQAGGGGQQPPPSVYQNNPYAQPTQPQQQPPYYGGNPQG